MLSDEALAKVIQGARERLAWEYNDSGLGSIKETPYRSFSTVREHNEFIASTPHAIIQLAERVRRLEVAMRSVDDSMQIEGEDGHPLYCIESEAYRYLMDCLNEEGANDA